MNFFQGVVRMDVLTDFKRLSALRHDLVSAQAVDIGIRLQDILGTHDAARFLKKNVIGIEVALRVLLNPERRRRT
jgi:hypothetical protein